MEKEKGAIAKAVDKMIHPHASEKKEQKPAPKKVSVEQGATSEGKHHHAKFDKFKKGNK